MSAAFQRMMDRFERRKKNFKRQVIDMIDGLFDEMVGEFAVLADEETVEELGNGGASGGSGNSSIRAEDDQQQHQLMDNYVGQSTANLAKLIRKTFTPQTTVTPLTTSSSNGQHQKQQCRGAKRRRENVPLVEKEHRASVSNIPVLMNILQDEAPPVKLEEFEEGFLDHNDVDLAFSQNFDDMETLHFSASNNQNESTINSMPETSTNNSTVVVNRSATHPPEPSDDSNSFDSSHFDISATQDSRYVSIMKLKCWVEGCNLLFEGKATLDTHISTAHSEIEAFHCFSGQCNKTFKYRSLRNNHIRTAHKNSSPLCCRFCGRNFKNMQSLTSHFNVIHEEGIFSCSICQFTADNRSEVRKHVRVAHPRFTCFCARSFSNQEGLAAHQQKMHISDRPFRCAFPDCPGYSATRKGQVVTHIRRVHFSLPISVKQQIEMGVQETRNPYDYIFEDPCLGGGGGGEGGGDEEGDEGEKSLVGRQIASTAPLMLKVVHSLKGNEQILHNHNNKTYTLERNGSYTSLTRSGNTTLYWRCSEYYTSKCVFRVSTGTFVAESEGGGEGGGYPFHSFTGEHICSASKQQVKRSER